MDNRIKVGIFVFNEVEVLDFAGPFEVFSLTKDGDDKLFEVITIGETYEPVSARNGLKILPAAIFKDNLKLDILIIPGGYGAEEIEIKNKTAIDWITGQQKKVKILASVCTGAFLLAECGLLNNRKATTHWMDLDRLENDFPEIEVIRNKKFVDEGEILTSGGISAGINMSFHIVSRLFGVEIAKKTAKRMEYDIEL
jgi:transcriptional regulator GlxA family with amidase domain